MWTAGVPDQNAAFLTNTTGSYVVSVDATPPIFEDLSLKNDGTHLTTLNINAPVVTSNSIVQIVGATLKINAGGSLYITNAANKITVGSTTVTGTLDCAGALTVTNGTSQIIVYSNSVFRQSSDTQILSGGNGSQASSVDLKAGASWIITGDAKVKTASFLMLANPAYFELSGTSDLTTQNRTFFAPQNPSDILNVVLKDDATLTFATEMFVLGAPWWYSGYHGKTVMTVKNRAKLREAGYNSSSFLGVYVGYMGGEGVLNIQDQAVVYAGNIQTNMVGASYWTAITNSNFIGGGLGTFTQTGGIFTNSQDNANSGTLYVGANGQGVLTVGEGGECSMYNIVLTNNVALVPNSGATVKFDLGTNSLGSLRARNSLTIAQNANLEVDLRGYTGDAVWIKLIDCATREGAFSPDNITIQGSGIVVQDKDEDIWLFCVRGTLITIQ